MARPTNKHEIVEQSRSTYKALLDFIETMTTTELITPFNFTQDAKKKEAHWRRDKHLRDILIHLYEWHELLLQWIQKNQIGLKASFLPAPYNWRNYGQMNMEFLNKHQQTSLQTAYDLLCSTHERVMTCLDSFQEEELFQKDVYPWVGGTTLGSYFISTTSSHYAWALKKLKAHRKQCKLREEVYGKQLVLVSACLVGEPCRYDGGCIEDSALQELVDSGMAMMFCPEVAGGLTTPRFPCEIVPHSNPPKVINHDGIDQTDAFVKGASMALSLCKDNDINLAILKSRSPSCGSSSVYDGSFSGNLIEGEGLTAKALREAGIQVLNEEIWTATLLFNK